jgi:CRP-like cAMP-binding protein
VEVRTQKDGKPVSLAVLSAGDFFGEVALISGKKRTASVYSKGKSVCIRLDKKDFDWALEKCPEVKKVVDAYVQKRVEGTISLISKLDW